MSLLIYHLKTIQTLTFIILFFFYLAYICKINLMFKLLK